MMSPAQQQSSHGPPCPPAHLYPHQHHHHHQLSPPSPYSSTTTAYSPYHQPFSPYSPYPLHSPYFPRTPQSQHCPSTGSSPTSDTSESPDHVSSRLGFGSQGILSPTGAANGSYASPPNRDIRHLPAPEITRPQDWNHGLPRLQGPQPPHHHRFQGHRGGGGGGGAAGCPATVTSGALEQLGWHSQTFPNIQESLTHPLMQFSHTGHYDPGSGGGGASSGGEFNLPVNLPSIGLTEEQLIVMPTRELNKTLKVTVQAKSLPREAIKSIKAMRRTMKNRGYAASCRVKRDEQSKSLTDSLNVNKQENEELQAEVHSLTKVVASMKYWIQTMETCATKPKLV